MSAFRRQQKSLNHGNRGFTREALYEADRATLSLTLVDLDDLAGLIVTHYETFDLEGRTRVPLVHIYWPVD